jgi:S-adenosylmethionine synthetase
VQSDFVFSSESVTAGHPDKLCDQISDALVDRYLRQDPLARVSAECAISTGILFLSLKARSDAGVDAPACAREVLQDVGYSADEGFDARGCTIMTSMYELPAELFPRISEEQVEERSLEYTPARDQTTVFGYASSDTEAGMPLPIWLAHRLARQLAAARKELPYLSPDGKVQVAVEYRDHRPRRVHGITLVACQRERGKPPPEQLADEIRARVVDVAFADLPIGLDSRTSIAINPEGPLVPGGPVLHAGLTGRKTSVDGYGDFGRMGSGALSGKDPSRIDRAGAYAARHAARNIVAAGLAQRCEVQLSYSIGLSHPVSVLVETFGTGSLDDRELATRLSKVFDLRPAGIVRRFRLRSLPSQREGTFYRHLAAYGQVGREDLELPWERLDGVDALKQR